jgi:uncharacterized membrane protein
MDGENTINGLVNRLFTKFRHRTPPRNVNEVAAQRLSLLDRAAVAITGAIGTMWAVLFFAAFMLGWTLWETCIDHQPFDPYPFAFLLFIGNIVQLLLMPLIMVGQNIQGAHAELRAEEAYKATLEGYRDAEHIMDHLVAVDRELLLHREYLAHVLLALGKEPPTQIIEGIHVSIEGTIYSRDREIEATDEKP